MYRYVLLPLIILLSACSTVTSKGYWGAGVGWPDGQRLRDSAVAAARSPYTWAPLAGALALGITDLDPEISDWAVEAAPLFGDHAAAARDRLKDVSPLPATATSTRGDSWPVGNLDGHAATL